MPIFGRRVGGNTTFQEDEYRTLPHRVLDGAVEFVVPHLNTYDVAVIQ